MNTHFRDGRKIDPTLLAYREWEGAGLVLPDLQQMRRFRWERLTDHVIARGYAGLLMFDPLNIRYATDSTNMQLWNTHTPFRAVLLCADGYMVIWDYKNAPFLSSFTPLVREQRSGASMFYFSTGDGGEDRARDLAGEIVDLATTAAAAPGAPWTRSCSRAPGRSKPAASS